MIRETKTGMFAGYQTCQYRYKNGETCGIFRKSHTGTRAAQHEFTATKKVKTVATDNRAEGEEHSPLPWHVAPIGSKRYVESDLKFICDMQRDSCQDEAEIAECDANAAFIVRACNEHYQLHAALTKASELGLGYQKRIEQLEQIIRDQMSVLRDWRGADNVPQQVRDAMAIRLTELRRVVEGG